MNKLSKLTRLTALSGIAATLILTSCKKVDQSPEVPAPTGGIINIGGTTWTSIHPGFVANERIMGMAAHDGKLVVTFLQMNGGDIYTSGQLNGSQISSHSFGYFMSGMGFEKAVVVDGNLYGLGLMDMYGSFKMNAGYLSGNGGLPWATHWSSYTNQTGIAKIGSEMVGSFGVSPYVRSMGSTTYPDVVRSGGTPSVDEVINYNGELICAGAFTSYNGTTLNNIARWDGTAWVPLGLGLNGEVEDLAVLNGELIACGKFTQTGDGNTACRYIAKWNGTSWSPLGTGLSGGFNGALTLCVYGGQLFVGGDFTTAGSVSSPNIAAWKGGSWSALAGGAPLAVGEIAVFDGHLYIANAFNSSGSNFLLRLD
jgi:hypothetical protein